MPWKQEEAEDHADNNNPKWNCSSIRKGSLFDELTKQMELKVEEAKAAAIQSVLSINQQEELDETRVVAMKKKS